MLTQGNKKINYIYKLSFAVQENSVIHYPVTKVLYGNAETIKQANNKLYTNLINDFDNLRIWIRPFFPYEKKLITNIEQSILLRSCFISKTKNMNTSDSDLYKEYVAWLTYMKTLSLKRPITPLKKYFITFFSLYNKLYIYDTKQQKYLRRHNYALNYFIVYWFNCQALEEILELPLFTEFVPYYEKLNPKIFFET